MLQQQSLTWPGQMFIWPRVSKSGQGDWVWVLGLAIGLDWPMYFAQNL